MPGFLTFLFNDVDTISCPIVENRKSTPLRTFGFDKSFAQFYHNHRKFGFGHTAKIKYINHHKQLSSNRRKYRQFGSLQNSIRSGYVAQSNR